MSLEAGANKDAQAGDVRKPCFQGNRDKDLQNRRGDTALMTAWRQGHLAIVCLLLEVSAHTDLQRHASCTAVSARCSRDMWRSHACYWKPGQTQMRKQGDGGGI